MGPDLAFVLVTCTLIGSAVCCVVVGLAARRLWRRVWYSVLPPMAMEQQVYMRDASLPAVPPPAVDTRTNTGDPHLRMDHQRFGTAGTSGLAGYSHGAHASSAECHERYAASHEHGGPWQGLGLGQVAHGRSRPMTRLFSGL